MLLLPMGTFQRLFYKLSKIMGLGKRTDLKISVSNKDLCRSCGKCSKVCPMQLAPYKEFSDKNQIDNEHCIRCSTCVKNCPVEILYLGTEEEAKGCNLEISRK
ncbi:hypothetical protein N752_16970 [Desulforamulus aquiferis]|nr:hypothetical protein N752_16970 [Desulforamulus aquiferis]